MKGARFDSKIGLVENASGIAFRCDTCKYWNDKKCANPNPELKDRRIQGEWCCNLYDHDGMHLIV